MSRIRKEKDIDYIFELKDDIQEKVKELKEIADRLDENSDEQYNMYLAINVISKIGENLWI